MQPGIMRGHLTRGVIKKDAYDFLRDVPVDQPGPKSVAPLMGRQMHCQAVLVADVAALQPEIELSAVGVRGQRSRAVGVHPRGREQPPAAAGPAFQDALLLGGDLALIAREAHALADNARAGRLALQDVSGGTFTVSNLAPTASTTSPPSSTRPRPRSSPSAPRKPSPSSATVNSLSAPPWR